LNPASLLPLDQEEEINHDCFQVIEQVNATPLDLRERLTALKNPDEEFYADGNSYMVHKERKAWYAMVTITKEKEVGTLSSNTSSQNAKLVALTRALELAKEKQVNIYTD